VEIDMKLNELIFHLEQIKEVLQTSRIDPNKIEVVFVADVLKGREEVLKNKKTITSTHLDAREEVLMFFDATSWEQYQKALK